MNETIRTILARRSTRAFEKRVIPGELLTQLGSAAYHAPCGMNRQLWHFTFVQNKQLLSELADAVGKAVGAGSGYSFYSPDVLLIATSDRESPHGAPDCACALENVFLAAESLGIGSVWINQLNSCCDEPAVRALLARAGIAGNQRVYGCAALGYPASGLPARAQKSESAVSYVL